MANPRNPNDPHRSDDSALPDGWIRTPLPSTPRDEPGTGGWFERTAEPPPPRTLAERRETADHSFARLVLWGGVLLALVFAILVLVL
jgi:hypothetical protein